MKNTILHWTSALLASTALLLTACSSDDDTKDDSAVLPVFPEMATLSIPAGETSCEVTFTPNMDWTVSIPTDPETARWFKISDGTIETFSITGKASTSPVTIYVTTIDQETFDETPVCEVSLTMGGQTQVIAKVTRGNLAREFSLYASTYDTGIDDFTIPYVYSQNAMTKYTGTQTSFPYDEAPEGTVELKWPTRVGGFMYVFKAQGNFKWLISTPEWITATSTAIDGEDAQQITLTGKFTEENIDGAVGLIDFYDASIDKEEDPGNNAHNKYCISMPAFRDIIRHPFANVNGTFTFNAQGKYLDVNGTENDNYTTSVSSTKGIGLYAVEQRDNGWYYQADWVTIEDKWVDNGEIFQSHDYTISVTSNSGTSRTATLLALPESVNAQIKDPLYDLFNEDCTDIKPEYKQYIYATIEQEGETGGEDEKGITISYNADAQYYISMGYLTFEDLTEVDPSTDEDVLANAGEIEMGAKLYRLTYNNAMFSTDSMGSFMLSINGNYTSSTINPYGNTWLVFYDASSGMVEPGSAVIGMSGEDGKQGTTGDKGSIAFYGNTEYGPGVVARIICVRNY